MQTEVGKKFVKRMTMKNYISASLGYIQSGDLRQIHTGHTFMSKNGRKKINELKYGLNKRKKREKLGKKEQLKKAKRKSRNE